MQSSEIELESEFDRRIIETPGRKFSRLTGEKIYKFIQTTSPTREREIITEYFKNKSIGYNSEGKIIKAFNV